MLAELFRPPGVVGIRGIRRRYPTLTKPEKRQNGDDDNDQANQIDHGVHWYLPCQ